MKFLKVGCERNFRISNDDPYAKERIWAELGLDDGEDEQKAINLARDKMVQNFKAAYPHVYTHLNFEVIEQQTYIPMKNHPNVQAYYDEVNKLNKEEAQTISKGTIEEQIQACTTLDELKSFELISKMNNKLFEQYREKQKQIATTKIKNHV